MKYKKVVATAGVLLAVALIGCGTSENGPGEDVTGTPAEQVTKLPSSENKEEEVLDAEVTPSEPEEEFPYELQFSSKEEAQEEKDGEFVFFKYAVTYPVFEGTYADNMNRFVSSLTEAFREELPSAKENAEYDYDEYKTNENMISMFPEEEEFVVSCLWSKEQYYTIFTKWFSQSGGAHPNTYCKAYVADVTTGQEECFENIIQPYGVTTEDVVAFAAKRIRSEHGEELFETDDEAALEEWVYGFTLDHQWYLNEKGLILFANPYDIAAYAYGMIECEISYEELEQGLKK